MISQIVTLISSFSKKKKKILPQKAKEAGLLPPSVTDEEESGSSTSSADETIGTRGPSSSGANSAQSLTANRNAADFVVKSPGEDGDVKKEPVVPTSEDGGKYCCFSPTAHPLSGAVGPVSQLKICSNFVFIVYHFLQKKLRASRKLITSRLMRPRKSWTPNQTYVLSCTSKYCQFTEASTQSKLITAIISFLQFSSSLYS